MSEPTDLTLVAARSAAYQAWRDKVSKSPYVTMDADGILDTVLAAAAPVFRDGYLSLASEKLEALASTVLAYNDYLEGRKDGVCESATVVSLLKGGQ